MPSQEEHETVLRCLIICGMTLSSQSDESDFLIPFYEKSAIMITNKKAMPNDSESDRLRSG
jgi:hypothetical protein